MYKKDKSPLEKSRGIIHWIKRKLLLIITAFMIGISNSINDEEDSINGNYVKMEQEDKRE